MKPKIYYNEINNTELIEKVKKLFPISFLSLGEVSFGGEILITIVKFENIDTLKSHWKQFNSFISTELFSLKKNEFSRWNFYVFYLSSVPIDRDLKYEIENNKFSSRKIAIEKCDDSINPETIVRIIKEHITNDNIIEISPGNDASGIKKNALIVNALSKFQVPTKKTEQSEYMNLVLSEIEKSLKNEI